MRARSAETRYISPRPDKTNEAKLKLYETTGCWPINPQNIKDLYARAVLTEYIETERRKAKNE